MHEAALAESILGALRDHVAVARAPSVRQVVVRIGSLAGVLPDSLEFCFDALVEGTAWRGARLLIEVVPAILRCQECHASASIEAPTFACPACGGSRFLVSGGLDLQLASLHLEEPPLVAPPPVPHTAEVIGP